MTAVLQITWRDSPGPTVFEILRCLQSLSMTNDSGRLKEIARSVGWLQLWTTNSHHYVSVVSLHAETDTATSLVPRPQMPGNEINSYNYSAFLSLLIGICMGKIGNDGSFCKLANANSYHWIELTKSFLFWCIDTGVWWWL